MEAHLGVSITVRWLDCVYAVAMEESDRSLTLGFTSYRGGSRFWGSTHKISTLILVPL